MDYHHTGKVTEYTDPAGHVTRNTFDANGNLLANTDPAGSTFNFEYDANEQPTITTSTITTANGVETVMIEKVYDRLNRVSEQIDADGLSTKAEYDALGRQTAPRSMNTMRSEMSKRCSIPMAPGLKTTMMSLVA
jgi:YD repeat-containing protein